MKTILNGRDLSALISLYPPHNYSLSLEDNVVLWVQELRIMGLLKPEDVLPNYSIWPQSFLSHFRK